MTSRRTGGRPYGRTEGYPDSGQDGGQDGARSEGWAERAAVTERLEELLGARSEREVALVGRLACGFDRKAVDLLDRWPGRPSGAGPDAPDDGPRALHTLRGAALNLGSRTLAELCQDVERCPPAGDDPAAVAACRARLGIAAGQFASLLTEVWSALAAEVSHPR